MLLDPPYRRFSSLQNAMISHLTEILAPDGTLLVETAADEEPELPLPKRTTPQVRIDPTDALRRRMITAIYPGTYDPVTNGHVDVITRAAAIFDRVVIGVVGNPQHKAPMFTLDERVGFLRDTVGGIENVEVDVFSELVVDFAHKWEAKVIVKGLRVISDFEWEFQMNQLNRTLAPDVETVYVMASPQVSFVSSSGVKEIASFGGKVDELVPEHGRARGSRSSSPTAGPERRRTRRNERLRPAGGKARERRPRAAPAPRGPGRAAEAACERRDE